MLLSADTLLGPSTLLGTDQGADATRLHAQALSRDGVIPNYHDLADVDELVLNNDGHVFLHLRKTGAGNCAVTIVTPGTIDGDLPINDRIVTVPATTGNVFTGPFPTAYYGRDLTVTFSNVEGLTLALLRA